MADKFVVLLWRRRPAQAFETLLKVYGEFVDEDAAQEFDATFRIGDGQRTSIEPLTDPREDIYGD